MCIINLMDLVSELYKNFSLSFFVLLALTFSCKDYIKVVRVATALVNLYEKAKFKGIFHVKCL